MQLQSLKRNSNIIIPHYHFLHCNSPSHAGVVGIFVKDTLQFRRLNDLSLQTPHCENLWLEIEGRATNIIVGAVYRHPGRNISSFQDELHNKLLNLETNKLNYIVCGDFNINTLEKSSKILDYINDLNSIGCNQMIDVPTKFASNCNSFLFDHIYTNIVKINHF